jgi:protein-disulfide isomerase
VPPARRQNQRPSRRSIHPLLAALAGAVVVAAALVAASLVGTSAGEGGTTPPPVSAAPAARDELFRGVPQNGIALGSPKAPVTLVEYADLQCPYCAEWARDALPPIVQEYVRSGRVRLVFRGLFFLGEQSETALRAALAAGEQDRLWDVVHGLFLHQGAENSGWVTDSLLRSFGGVGLDTERMLDSTRSSWVESQLVAARSAATVAGVDGTPFFQAGPTGGALERLNVSALDADTFRRELDRLLAG